MKVILTRDYDKLGNTGDIINVKDGFAQNFLIPNSIAILATEGNIRQMEIVKKSLIKKEAKNIAEAQKIAEVIDGIELKFKVNSSPEGKLYGSITNKDIADMILENKKVEIDRKKIELEEHIKEVGIYDIEVKLYKDVKAIVKVEVSSEDVIKEEEKKETADKESVKPDSDTVEQKGPGEQSAEDKATEAQDNEIQAAEESGDKQPDEALKKEENQEK